jgi:lipoyl(octanoyl) transferase
MDEMLLSLNLSDFDLLPENFSRANERTLILKKWNWHYEKAHRFQKEMVKRLADFPRQRLFIFCNHPRSFTYGRGLQKPKKGQSFELSDFNLDDAPSLPFPFYKIERGGGLTFHHPGQFIFYPLVKLNPTTLSLSKMIDDILDASIDVLSSWGIDGLHHENTLLGLWQGDHKLASVGIAIERLTTFHGMALNLFKDSLMLNSMKALNPCGINTETYLSVEELLPLPEDALEKFANSFSERILHAWK